MSFRNLSTAIAVISAALFVVLVFAPEVIWWLFGLEGGVSADFAFRRAGMIFVAIALVGWGARDEPPSPLRDTLTIGLAVMMGALAALGCWELLRGVAGPGILLAVAAETVLALGFARLLLKPEDSA